MTTRGRARRLGALAAGAIAGSAALFVARAAHADPVRLLVAVGDKRGLDAERPLKFADTDAARVRDVMVSMAGVRPENATVLAEPTVAQLYAALDKVKAEAAKRKPDEVTVIFYFSGHGDREAIHLGDARVAISDLSARLQQIPASLRIVVTDACRATRPKGMTAESAFPISLGQLPQATGSVWLNAASDGEAAQESDELQGAIFTHAWLNGLRGAADANGDARVTLDESFAFAHSQTLLRSAKSSGVIQKPEAVVSLKETAPVVLTQTASRLAVLSLPPSRDTHYLVYAAGAKSVLAELWGSGERRTSLAVPPGRYVIHRRVGGSGALATIAIGKGEERPLEGADFRPMSLEALARKGGDIDGPGGSDGEGAGAAGDAVAADRAAGASAPTRSHHEIFAGYDVGSSARYPLVQGPSAGYAYLLGGSGRVDWALLLGGALEMSKVDRGLGTEKTVTPVGRVAIEPRFALGRYLTARAGAGARAGAIVQTLTRKDAAVLERGGYSGTTTNTAFVWGPEAHAGVRLSTSGERSAGVFVDAEASSNLAIFVEENETKVVPALIGALSLGARF
jgi:hypothetical protein